MLHKRRVMASSTLGEYTYFCSLHPHMTGTIVVEGTAGSSASQ